MPDNPKTYFKELRLQQFRSLIALAHWHTFSAAATALKLTRASVWQQIRGLEEEMQAKLLLTRGQRVEFTDAGRKLVEIVAPLVAQFDSVKPAFDASVRNDKPHTLTIVTPATFLVYELQKPISRIHALFPKLHLTFVERNSPAAIELLDQGGADLAIAARPGSVPMKAASSLF